MWNRWHAVPGADYPLREVSLTQRLQSLIKQWFPLFLISALSLYLELAVVRWFAVEVGVFSYF